MAKSDEISSTERLLDLIRDDNKESYIASSLTTKKSVGNRFKGFLNNPVSFKKAITVGVDLGHDDLKMVKINRISDQKYEILDYAWIPFESDIPRESAQLYQFLRPVLNEFIGSSRNI